MGLDFAGRLFPLGSIRGSLGTARAELRCAVAACLPWRCFFSIHARAVWSLSSRPGSKHAGRALVARSTLKRRLATGTSGMLSRKE